MNLVLNKISRFNINKVITILLICSAMTMRPTAMGQNYSSISILLSLASLFIYSYVYRGKIVYFFKKQRNYIIFISIYIFWIYCGIQSLVKNSNNIEFSLKAIIINVTIMFVFSIILSNEKINNSFFRLIIIILSLFCISYYITLILSFIVGLENLFLFKLDIGGYSNIGKVYFPMTIEYNKTSINSIIIIRALGFCREAGITQMFYLWGFFAGYRYFINQKTIKVIMFLGVISCFSTSGFIIFIIVYGFKILISCKTDKLKVVIPIIFLIISFYTFMNTDGIRIQDKAQDSINDRTYAIQVGIELLSQNPLLGYGFYNGIRDSNLGINFISSMYMIGIIGVLLYSLIFIAPIIKVKYKWNFIIGISPIIITLLFAQPLMDSPLIYIMLLANYDKKYIKKNIENIRDISYI